MSRNMNKKKKRSISHFFSSALHSTKTAQPQMIPTPKSKSNKQLLATPFFPTPPIEVKQLLAKLSPPTPYTDARRPKYAFPAPHPPPCYKPVNIAVKNTLQPPSQNPEKRGVETYDCQNPHSGRAGSADWREDHRVPRLSIGK